MRLAAEKENSTALTCALNVVFVLDKSESVGSGNWNNVPPLPLPLSYIRNLASV